MGFCLVQVEEGWWSGSLKGKSGLFPSNFVKEMDAAEGEAETNDVAGDEAGKEENTNIQRLINHQVNV